MKRHSMRKNNDNRLTDCRKCIWYEPILDIYTGCCNTFTCHPPEESGDRKSTNGYCFFFEREPGSDDYIGEED